MKQEVEINSKQIYINGISKIIRSPYFKFLRVDEVPEELCNDIFSKLFKQKVIIDNNRVFDSNNNQIYSEYSDGNWFKFEYDSNNNLIYSENSYGEIIEYGPNNLENMIQIIISYSMKIQMVK